MFDFISSYQGQFDYRKIGDKSGRRYRLKTHEGNRLTVGYDKPTAQELADFQAWQCWKSDLDQLTMLANPRRYPRKFWEVTAQPQHLATA
jgi:hypothetical protein